MQQEPGTPLDQEGSRIRRDERWIVALAVSWLYCILLAYFIVRPVRETMGTIVDKAELTTLFLASFIVMILIVPVYGWLVAKLPRRWLVRVVFHFFAACLLVFWSLVQSESPQVQLWMARVLFIWISIFGVFSTSVFWSVLADLFSSQQGRRLFGVVAAGGTAGAITGSFLTSQLAAYFTTGSLLILPAIAIEVGLAVAWRLEKTAAGNRMNDVADVATADTVETSMDKGGLMAGVTHILRSPYLASICLFLFFVQGFGTQLYFEQAEIVSAEISDKDDRTQLFAYLDLGTQLLTLVIQIGLSGWILRRLGVSIALVILPVVYFAAFLALAIQPSLTVLIVSMIAARGVGYGITVPSREVLFTVVSREDKYKSKNFIDTVVLRGGDTLSAQIVGSLQSAGVGLTVLNLAALPFVAAWGALSWSLGRRQRARAEKQRSSSTESAVAVPR